MGESRMKNRGLRRCKCGSYTSGPTATYCNECRRRKYRTHVVGTENMTEESAKWFAVIERHTPITYGMAADIWDVDIHESIKRINALVRADKLKGIGPGRFEVVPNERD